MPLSDSFAPAAALSLYDARPFFEKALLFGIQNKLLDQAKLDAINADAPKGMVQIARYFGNEFLRPELEQAKNRLVNLVSLCLEHDSGGDVRLAAEALRDHSLLSRSKRGADLLKALIGLPQTSHFGMNGPTGFRDEQIGLLAEWSLKSLAEYQAELARRQQVAQLMDAAIWLADFLDLPASELQDIGPDAEAVIRTALLTLACKRAEMPGRLAFENMMKAWRKKHGADVSSIALPIPQQLPKLFKAVVLAVRASVVADLSQILDNRVSVRKLFNQTPAFSDRYFWLENAVDEVDLYDRSASAAWNKLTGGHTHESELLTLLLCVASDTKPKPLLTEKAASTLIRKIQKNGLQPELARQWLKDNAPVQHQSDYLKLWDDFVEESQRTLQSDAVAAIDDALKLLWRECNLK